ncbi:hypothetical protein AAHB40_14525 [Bacillus velezensis]
MNILRIIFSSVPYVMFVIILSRHLGFEFAKTYYWWFAAFFVIGLIGKFVMHLAAKKETVKKRDSVNAHVSFYLLFCSTPRV